MKKKKQILFIHGGETFKRKKDYLNYLKTRKISIEKKPGWALEYLDKELRKKFEIIRPRMPLSENAKYEEWKIYFERFFPFLRNDVIFIGNSLGSMFLAKYFSENKFSKKILAIFLVCPPFDNTCYSIHPGDEITNRFKLKSDLSLIEKNCKNVTLMFSADDDVVPVAHAEKYRNKLKNAKIIIYKSKNGHFKISKFPEIVKMIKDDIKRSK
jgi:predicted alpha/beta hydrolase family esterase